MVFGASIYYLLPLSLLSFDLSMILRIFFFILLGMLFGLCLIAVNVQRLFEIALTYIFFFWERKSMKRMIMNNLKTHKNRNR